VTAWGWLDDDHTIPATVPQEIADADVVQVDAGYNQDLALTADGRVLAWGRDDGDTTQVPAALAELDVARVDVGYHGAVALTTDGRVVSWGAIGETPASLDDETVVAVSVGYVDAMALTADGDLVAWGQDGAQVHDIPQVVQDGDVVAFGLGEGGAMAATSDGVIHSWGSEMDPSFVPETNGTPIADLQVDRYRATVVYAALVNDVAPTVSGDPVVGTTLEATTGTWASTPDSYRYQWLRDGLPVGTGAATYKLTSADADHAVTVRVTAIQGAASGVATSAPLEVRRRTFTTAPRVTLSGTPRVGELLTLKVSDVAPRPDGYTRTWFRDGRRIRGAAGASYRLIR
jgi:hypothetical protein